MPPAAAAPPAVPVLWRDPRYVAGRQTIGQPTSIDTFALLLEEVTNKFGNEHVEAAPAFYEYGNALFRVAQRARDEAQEEEEESESKKQQASAANSREAAALAAERRAQQQAVGSAQDKGDDDDDDDDDAKKPAAVDTTQQTKNDKTNESTDNDEAENDDDGVEDDLLLALEMMENAYAILEKAHESSSDGNNCTTTTKHKYADWIRDQMPRILTGLGDVLSALDRHADALDAYLRALEHRQTRLQEAIAAATERSSTAEARRRLLLDRRRVVEANTLIVEELLACDLERDITTTETKVVLVPKGRGVEYATGYYEKARDELQETVTLMGQLQAEGHNPGDEEQENVCFAATLVMAAGESLAAMDDTESTNGEPQKKKAKA